MRGVARRLQSMLPHDTKLMNRGRQNVDLNMTPSRCSYMNGNLLRRLVYPILAFCYFWQHAERFVVGKYPSCFARPVSMRGSDAKLNFFCFRYLGFKIATVFCFESTSVIVFAPRVLLCFVGNGKRLQPYMLICSLAES